MPLQAHKPRLSAIPPKCSQRNLSQPVLESGEKLRRMAERKHKRNTSELTAQEKSDRAKARWKFATTEVKQMIRDARTMAYQVLKSEIDTENAANQVIFSRHGVRIAISLCLQ